jgi:hypothetical protein
MACTLDVGAQAGAAKPKDASAEGKDDKSGDRGKEKEKDREDLRPEDPPLGTFFHVLTGRF